MIGPGKYDDLCTLVREGTGAQAAIVIVLGGNRGSGFSCQADLATTIALPDMLESVARQMRESISE